MNKYDLKHLSNLTTVQRQVERVFNAAIQEAARIGVKIDEISPDRLFSFADYPLTRKEIEKLLDRLKTGLSGVIVNGIRSAWTLSNNKNDELARQVFGDNVGRLSQAQYRRYFSTNGAALDAFLARKENGLNLSDRVWRYTEAFKNEIELGLDVGIRNGLSADEMSRELRQWLQHPDMLFRRVRDEHGQLKLSQRAAAFHPGRGVYRSSYKNARRLAATETNIAYRTADHERWQQLDFVVGIRIVLSNNHTLLGSDGKPHPFTDICDELSAPLGSTNTRGKGCYPKDFKFTGWHPHCRCHAESILKTEEEMAADTQKILNGEPLDGESVNRVDDVPQEFKDWATEHSEQIAASRGRGTEPYFIKNNAAVIDGILKSGNLQSALSPFERNMQDVADTLGVKAGSPMTFEEANEKRGNPNYAKDKQYRINCQSCVVANEMRRRGIDVEAYGNIQKKGSNTYALSMKTEAAWVDDNGKIPVPTVIRREIKKTNATINKNGYVRVTKSLERDDELKKKIADAMSDVGRYHISWMWKKKKSGHIITAERLSDGTLRFYDPQTGKTGFGWSMSDIDAYRSGFKILRVDTLKTNVDVISGVVKRSGSTAGTPMMTEIQKAFWKATDVGKWATDGSKLTQIQKDLRRSERFPIANEKNLVNLHSGMLAFSGKSRKAFISHCKSEAELEAAEYIWNNPEMLEYIESTTLGYVKDMNNEKDRKNVAKKKKRGVQRYNEYQFKFKGKTWHIKLEQTKFGKEQFYCIIKK